MRAIAYFVAAVLLAGALSASAENLPPLPSRTEIVPAVWENYSRQILHTLFPARAKTIRKMKIHLMESDTAFAGSNLREILVTTGRIRAVPDEHEYAAVLAHEFGHRLRNDGSASLLPLKSPLLLATANEPSFVSWPRYFSQELTADLVSAFVSRVPDVWANWLERYVGSIPKDSMWYGPETLRHRALVNLIATNRLRPLLGARPLPRKLPKRSAPDAEWVAYATSLLTAMYPAYTDLLAQTQVGFVKSEIVPCAYAFVFENGNLIALNRGYINAVVKKPEEFATVLGHEFSHIVLERDLNVDYAEAGIKPTEASYLREETEADLFATLPLERGECHFATVLDRTIRYSPGGVPYVYNDPKDEADDRARLNRVRAMCSLNY